MKLALLLFLAACATEAGPPEVSSRDISECDTWACGTNSPTVGDGLLFDELDSSGARSPGGLTIDGAITADNTPIRITVKRDVLIGTSDTGRTYQGIALQGTIIKLHSDWGGHYELLLSRYDQTLFWSGEPKYVPFFEVLARRAGEKQFLEYACKYDALLDDPYWTSVPHSALFFEGDRYDPVLKTVRDSVPGDPIFNVACAGTTPAKMHLLRHTNAGAWDVITGLRSYPTTVEVRQTMLKLLTADYCGTGHSYTVDGQRLAYSDSVGSWWTPAGAMEAIWSADKAVCLNTMRHPASGPIGCALPACPITIFPWNVYGEAMSQLRP